MKRREIISSNVFVVLPMRMPIKKTVNIAPSGEEALSVDVVEEEKMLKV